MDVQLRLLLRVSAMREGGSVLVPHMYEPSQPHHHVLFGLLCAH